MGRDTILPLSHDQKCGVNFLVLQSRPRRPRTLACEENSATALISPISDSDLPKTCAKCKSTTFFVGNPMVGTTFVTQLIFIRKFIKKQLQTES